MQDAHGTCRTILGFQVQIELQGLAGGAVAVIGGATQEFRGLAGNDIGEAECVGSRLVRALQQPPAKRGIHMLDLPVSPVRHETNGKGIEIAYAVFELLAGHAHCATCSCVMSDARHAMSLPLPLAPMQRTERRNQTPARVNGTNSSADLTSFGGADQPEIGLGRLRFADEKLLQPVEGLAVFGRPQQLAAWRRW